MPETTETAKTEELLKSSGYFDPNPLVETTENKPRGRRSRQIDMAQEVEPGELVTYLPGGPDDPAAVKWNGHIFNAHVPKRITDERMIASARGSKFWHVGHFDAQARSVALSAAADLPTTPEQYRAHVVAWLKKVTTIDDMVKTWVAEQNMRELCGVGSDDYAYIGSLFKPKMYELARAAELNDMQLADLWRAYSVFQLPF